MITAEERENLLKVIQDWDFKESKILMFGVVYDIQKNNSKAIDKGQSIYLKINEEVNEELKEKDNLTDLNITFKNGINDVINWYPDIRNKALDASRKIRNMKKIKNKIELYKDIIRYASMVITVQVYAIAGLIEDDLYIDHSDMKREDVVKIIVDTTKVLHAFYIKFMYQFDTEIKPGNDINEIIIPIYKDKEKYEVLLNTMIDIGLMSLIPNSVINKCTILDGNGTREENLKKIERRNEKKELLN